MIAAAVFLLPVGAMIIDNRAGQLLHGHIAAWLAYRRAVGVYDPGAGDRAVGYELHRRRRCRACRGGSDAG